MVKFSDRMIAGLKPQEKEYRVSEGNGFILRVRPSGVKIWTYRYRSGSRNVMLTIGHYPAMSLADARKAHADACHQRDRGVDPVSARNEARLERVETVADLAEIYLRDWARPRKKSCDEDERILTVDVLPVFRHVKLVDLRRRAVVDFLKTKARTAPNAAWQMLKILRRMFNFALEQDFPGIEANPCAHIKLQAPTPKERVLSREEIALFWRVTAAEGFAQTAAALRLVLLTGQRPGEVIGMHRREIDGEWWTIPPERSKNKRANRVFLTPTALALITGPTPYVFPGEPAENEPDRPRNTNALAHYLRRKLVVTADKRVKGFAGRKKHEASKKGTKVPALAVPYFTPHDLRRTAATRMAEAGIAPHTIARVLNHVDRSVTGMHYNHYSYDAEKKEAMLAWERTLLEIVGK